MNRDDLIQQLFSNHANHNSTPHSNDSSKASFKNAKGASSKSTYKNEPFQRSNASSKSFSKHEGQKNGSKNNNTSKRKR